MKAVATNRKAYHDYFILEEVEAGIVLTGTEIKSVRDSKVNLHDSYARVENNEVFLYNMHISPYEAGNRYNVDPLRRRKLLLHKQEIRRLIGKVKEKGLSLVPLKIYISNRGLAKITLALVKGKKLYDRRETLAKRDADMEIARAIKERQKG
ncbi:MAG: SsrA-binding protein SmpB [bacterium]|jgi:SsrA-binding protein|nr:SsrA-binding protein SmpB [bacterium]MDD3804706.1 SsrA-binding protein SmpB [bacterium]MDD4152558.1 SsrA-binding protein SmpB [bacterium]